jgi:leader peptidase (prepilin peptidase)/N-methyltransferase
LFALAAVVDGHGHALLRAAVGMIGLPATYLTVALLSRGGLGAGDIRLAALVGLALAWRSWTALTTGTLMAFGYACAAGLIAITVLLAPP